MRWIFKSFINTSTIILLLRLMIGIVFFMHGSQKVLGAFGGHGLEATAAFMSKIGIPSFLAYVASFAEFLGGIFLILGLVTRFASLAIVIDMLVAIFQVHIVNGFFNPTGIEFPLTLMTIAACIFLYGPGEYSVDELIARRYRRIHVTKDGGISTEYKTNYRS